MRPTSGIVRRNAPSPLREATMTTAVLLNGPSLETPAAKAEAEAAPLRGPHAEIPRARASSAQYVW